VEQTLVTEITITGNSNNSIFYAAQTFSPDASTRYRIMDTFGIATSGSTTSIVILLKLADKQVVWKRLRITGGTGQGLEFAITSNSANTLVFWNYNNYGRYYLHHTRSLNKVQGIEFSWLFWFKRR
jgi:hypothetical protein